MRILQVTNFFKPSWESGGPARVAYDLSKKLVERGHEVTVYTTDGFKKRLDVDKNVPVDVDGISTYYFRNLSSYLAKEMVLPIPFYMPVVARKEMSRFDIVHIHEYRTASAVIVHHYARKYRIPYVLQAHGSLPRIIEKKRLKKLFDSFFGYQILKDASKLVAVSRVEMRQYNQFDIDEEKIVRIPNGLDIDTFRVLPERGEFRERYGIREKHMVLFLGRIHRIKGLDFLMKAFASLTTGRKDIALVIAGPDDGYKGELLKLMKSLNLRDEVKFVGYLDNPLSAYVDADVLVHPAAYEIFGLVPFEAIMCGTPVIVTVDCGCGEIMKEAKAGYLVKYGDTNSLEEKIKAAIEDPGEGCEMAASGKRYILENLTWDKVMNIVEELYADCIYHS